MTIYGLPITCVTCGQDLAIVALGKPVAGREVNSLLACRGCNTEWLVRVSMTAAAGNGGPGVKRVDPRLAKVS